MLREKKLLTTFLKREEVKEIVRGLVRLQLTL